MNCIIIDDEPIARRGMARLVGNDSRLELKGSFASVEEGAAFMAENPVNLVFLDIRMPGMSGLDFARRIPEQTLVIFTTAYSEYAVDSYEVDAIDYLVKPIDPARFERAVGKAVEYKELLSRIPAEAAGKASSPEHILLKADRRYHRVPYDAILYVEGLKDYVIVHLDGRKIVTRMTIKGMEELLPAPLFVRVNKSYIVRLNAVDSFDSNDVFVGDTEIAIGAVYREAVLSRLLG